MVAVSMITGHCIFAIHAKGLGLIYNDFCRNCHREEEQIEGDYVASPWWPRLAPQLWDFPQPLNPLEIPALADD
ncbi:hypothetical protein EVAR_71606_1 [Eumeta japonica]|uniref:Uncharacterized protein n=1 Tax=Eumeta variegata TaxID=151549 RepID=A0A4C1TBR1_EUMVA|nr:hypothetical protein EVAR_71606_1 [Eumeta japonica]